MPAPWCSPASSAATGRPSWSSTPTACARATLTCRRSRPRRAPEVKAGRVPSGRAGRSGRATGTHLHFEVTQNGRPIDPQSFSAGAQARRVTCRLGGCALGPPSLGALPTARLKPRSRRQISSRDRGKVRQGDDMKSTVIDLRRKPKRWHAPTRERQEARAEPCSRHRRSGRGVRGRQEGPGPGGRRGESRATRCPTSGRKPLRAAAPRLESGELGADAGKLADAIIDDLLEQSSSMAGSRAVSATMRLRLCPRRRGRVARARPGGRPAGERGRARVRAGGAAAR